MARTNPTRDTASIPTSSCSIPTPNSWSPLYWGPELFGYQLDHAERSSTTSATARRDAESAASSTGLHLGAARKPEVAWERTIVYEMHVKGLPSCIRLVPDADGARSRPRAFGDPGYLRSLGITSAELLPNPCLRRRQHLVEKGLRNSGATTPSLFAPEPRYLKTPLANESKPWSTSSTPIASSDPRRRLQHTAEGNGLADPVVQGIDNAAITACCRPSSATTSTTPAPGTR